MEMKFYYCEHCGNIIAFVKSSGVPVFCCGEKMKELVPNTTDAAKEKHVPVVSVDGNRVTVEIGSVPHPMTEAHYIQWVVLQTKQLTQRKSLNPGDEPKAVFHLDGGDEIVAVYAFCNLHGLWKA